jgi:AraC family transcriptional regulator
MHAITRLTRSPGVHLESNATLEIVVDGTLIDGDYTLRHGCAIYRPAGARRTIRAKNAESLLIVVSGGPSITVAETTARAWAISLIQELQTRDPGWELIVDGLILVGLGRLTRVAELAAHRPAWLDDAVDLARAQQPLVAIARRIGRHPSHVAREFHRHEGVTVGEFARRCRLELAARALREGERSIGEVALDAGFCDQSHFTNAFRRVFGVTPGRMQTAVSDPNVPFQSCSG